MLRHVSLLDLSSYIEETTLNISSAMPVFVPLFLQPLLASDSNPAHTLLKFRSIRVAFASTESAHKKHAIVCMHAWAVIYYDTSTHHFRAKNANYDVLH